jgi:hypothetical protein
VQALLGAGLYLQYNSMEIWNHGTLMLSCGAFGGYLAVVVGMILAALVQQPVPKRAVSYSFSFLKHGKLFENWWLKILSHTSICITFFLIKLSAISA